MQKRKTAAGLLILFVVAGDPSGYGCIQPIVKLLNDKYEPFVKDASIIGIKVVTCDAAPHLFENIIEPG